MFPQGSSQEYKYQKQSSSNLSQNHHIMALKSGDYFLFAFDLGNRAIGTKEIPHHPNQQVIVQYRGTQPHKVSDDIWMFPNAHWDSVIRTVAPRTCWWLEIYNHINLPWSSTSEGCEWWRTSGLWDCPPPWPASSLLMGHPSFKSCPTRSWTIIFVSS